MAFKKAIRSQGHARIGLCGPSGSGKTHSALKLAAGLAPNGRIFVLDTEQYSASLEAGKSGIPDFFVDALDPPYSIKRYIDAMEEAFKQNPEVLIIDSISHAWASVGGILDSVERIRSASKTKNAFAGWREATPQHNKFVSTIMTAPCHVICTMRSQVQHLIDEDNNGKKQVRKVGMKPIQREGMDYEFTIVFDIERDGHLASASKDRTSLFDDIHPAMLSEATGRQIYEWLMDESLPQAEVRTPVIEKTLPNGGGPSNGANQITQRLSELAITAGFDSLEESLSGLGFDIEPCDIDMDLAVKIANSLKAHNGNGAALTPSAARS